MIEQQTKDLYSVKGDKGGTAFFSHKALKEFAEEIEMFISLQETTRKLDKELIADTK